MDITNFTNTTTMTSKEIAALTGKEHKNILQDIRKMESEIDRLRVQPISYKDQMNREQTMYTLDKKASLLLVSGYNIQLRHAIIERWEELETNYVQLTNEENKMLKQQLAEKPKMINTNNRTKSGTVHKLRRHLADRGACDHVKSAMTRHQFPVNIDGECDGFHKDKNGNIDIYRIPAEFMDETIEELLSELAE